MIGKFSEAFVEGAAECGNFAGVFSDGFLSPTVGNGAQQGDEGEGLVAVDLMKGAEHGVHGAVAAVDAQHVDAALSEALGERHQVVEIAGLTEPLVGLSEPQRNLALKRLEAARLLTVNRNAAGELVSLDAHPLIREYFAGRVKSEG